LLTISPRLSRSDDLDLNSELLAKLLYLLEQVRDFPTMLEVRTLPIYFDLDLRLC